MELEQASAMLSKLVLHIGRQGRPVGFWEIAFGLGYSEDAVHEMLKTLEEHGILNRCDTPDCPGFTLDARYIEDALQTLVTEDKLVAYTAQGRTHYFSPENWTDVPPEPGAGGRDAAS